MSKISDSSINNFDKYKDRNNYHGDDYESDDYGVIGTVEWDNSDGDYDSDLLEESDYCDRSSTCSLGRVTICGQPNVGKSSLINRILGRREAVVEDIPGVTRDRVRYDALWNGKNFTIEDTGGWEPRAQGLYFSVAKQSELAIADSDLILFIVDATLGITVADEQLASLLHKSSKQVLLVVNKVDGEKISYQIGEFWSLGFGEPYGVSATHGLGVADLLDRVVYLLEESVSPDDTDHDSYRRVALVGKPNVGKSSLLNYLAHQERSVVSPVAGTTVDPVDSLVDIGGVTWRFIDTAGLKRKVHALRGHEYYAVLRTQSAIESAEVVLVLIDASQPLSDQDQRVISMVADAGRAMVLIFNKWDLLTKDRRYDLEQEIDRQLERVWWASRVNISAATGRGIHRIEKVLCEALNSWDERISTAQLNSWLREVIAANPPPVRSGKITKVLFATQVSVRPPTFILFTSGFLEAGYRRFIERRLRESFGFHGTPIRINLKIREKKKLARRK